MGWCQNIASYWFEGQFCQRDYGSWSCNNLGDEWIRDDMFYEGFTRGMYELLSELGVCPRKAFLKR